MRLPLVALLCAFMFAGTFSIGAFPALLPDIGRAGGLRDAELGALAASFGFARMLADLPVGALVTRRLRQALLASPLLLVVGALGLASGGPLAVLLLSRAVMGAGHALGAVGALTAILRFQSAGGLASALSAFELSAMLGVLGGTAMLAVLPADLSWNVALLATCTPQLLGLALLPLLLRALPADVRPAVGGAVRVERTGGAMPVRPGVLLAFAAGAIAALAYSTLEQFEIPLRASRDFGLDRTGVARLLMTVQVFDIACLLPFGVLADRVGAARVLGAALLLFSVSTALVGFGDLRTLVLGCALFGVAMASWTLPLSVLRQETLPSDVGWRTALYRVGVDAGIFLGPFASGLLSPRWPALVPVVLAVALAATGLLAFRYRPTAAERTPG